MKNLRFTAAAILALLATRPAQADYQTDKWSGYVARTVHTGQYYSQISATWRVPPVKWGQTLRDPYGYQYNTIWIGIGGVGDQQLLQMGTQTTVTKTGTQRQYMWYELYPAVSVLIPGSLAAGETVDVSMKCVANCSPSVVQTWDLRLFNRNRNWTWTKRVNFQASMLSAEWVLEAPYWGGVLPLNNYTKHTFSNLRANNQIPQLDLGRDAAYQANPNGQTSNPAAPASGYFSTCYGYQTYTPCVSTP